MAPMGTTMNISGIASLATAMTQERQSQEIGLAVLKKALDADKASAALLIQAASAAAPARQANLPAHLGQNINTTA